MPPPRARPVHSNCGNDHPAVPGSFAATGVSASEVDLSWTDVTGATAYEVDRENLDSTWTALTTTLPANATTFADTGLESATTTTYRVEALDATGPSASTSLESGLTYPAIVAGVTRAPWRAPPRSTLNWTDDSAKPSRTIACWNRPAARFQQVGSDLCVRSATSLAVTSPEPRRPPINLKSWPSMPAEPVRLIPGSPANIGPTPAPAPI